MSFGYNGYMNNANPYTRNYGMNNYSQPQQMVQQPMQYEMPIQYVGNGTIKEAEGYIVFPNQKAIFIDKPNGMVYEKICSQDGQSFITQFKRVENQAVEPQNQEPTIDLSSYVKKDELGAFVSLKQYNELNEKFEELKKVIGGKQNVPTK